MTERASGVQGDKKVSRGKAKAPAERPRAARARALSEIVPEIGGVHFRRFGFVQSAVVSRWPEIVGQRYAKVSAPESIRFPVGKKSDGVLTLSVEGAHAPMMQHIAPTLIERVNRFFGYPAVARVQIRQSAATPRPRRKTPARTIHQPAELGDSLRSVSDPELRAVLESLAEGLSFTTGAPRLPESSE
jgi:hypothetical protein